MGWHHRRGSTQCGSEVPSFPRCPRSRRCGSRRMSTMIPVRESCTENASKAMSVHFYLHFLDEMAFILFVVNGVFMAFFHRSTRWNRFGFSFLKCLDSMSTVSASTSETTLSLHARGVLTRRPRFLSR